MLLLQVGHRGMVLSWCPPLNPVNPVPDPVHACLMQGGFPSSVNPFGNVLTDTLGSVSSR